LAREDKIIAPGKISGGWRKEVRQWQTDFGLNLTVID